MKSKLMMVAVVAAMAGFSASVQADVIAFDPSGLQVVPGEPTGNDGLFFTPTVGITVTALGYYDCGFSVNHPVGLYDVTSDTEITEVTVTGSSTLSDNFRYVSITPYTLTAGDEYAVVGFYEPGSGDTGYYATISAGANPEIGYDSYEYDYNGSLDLPTIGYAPPIFGPNFQFIAVPDGGMTVSLLGSAVGACGLFVRRMKKQA